MAEVAEMKTGCLLCQALAGFGPCGRCGVSPQVLTMPEADLYLTEPIPGKPPGDFGPEYVPPAVPGPPVSPMQQKIENRK